MIRHSLRHLEHEGRSEPQLVITVRGIDDVYRLARHLEIGQYEFAQVGVAVLRGLDRKNPGLVSRQRARMGPDRGYPGVRPRAGRPSGSLEKLLHPEDHDGR